MSIVAYNQVRMANLSVAASHTVNGVSALHSEILKASVFHDYYKAMPYKFTNVTNGIAHRRWLCESNPGLTALSRAQDRRRLTVCIRRRFPILPHMRMIPPCSTSLQDIKRENKARLAQVLLRSLQCKGRYLVDIRRSGKAHSRVQASNAERPAHNRTV